MTTSPEVCIEPRDLVCAERGAEVGTDPVLAEGPDRKGHELKRLAAALNTTVGNRGGWTGLVKATAARILAFPASSEVA